MEADELSLATRAAWLSYVGNQTQEEIAGRLGVSRVKVNRLIGQAVRAGLVHVFVEGTAAECIALEEKIASRWGLEFCTVAPSAEDAPLPLATLAGAGGHWLHRVLEAGRVSLIGVGHGRTLAAVVSSLPRLPRPRVRFVSLLGSLTRHSAANPFDVIHRLTEITGAESYFMPAPFFADSIEDKAVLLGQRSLEAVFELARTAELVVVGIGEVGPHSHLLTSGMITARGVRRGRARRCGRRAARALRRRPWPPGGGRHQRPGPRGPARGSARPAGGGGRRRPRQAPRDRGRARERAAHRADHRRGDRPRAGGPRRCGGCFAGRPSFGNNDHRESWSCLTRNAI